jgi:hypothetical protein
MSKKLYKKVVDNKEIQDITRNDFTYNHDDNVWFLNFATIGKGYRGLPYNIAISGDEFNERDQNGKLIYNDDLIRRILQKHKNEADQDWSDLKKSFPLNESFSSFWKLRSPS